jgi:hypothetical protein
MDTVKLDLGDGDYAVLFKEIKHKTSKALQRLLRDSITPQEFAQLQLELRKAKDNEEIKEILGRREIDGDDVVTLVNQAESWSFGTISKETIDNMPETKYQLLLTEVNKLYSQVPLAVNK